MSLESGALVSSNLLTELEAGELMRTEYTLTPEQRKDFFSSEGEKCLVKNGIKFYPKHRVRQYAMSLQNLYPKLGNLWPSR